MHRNKGSALISALFIMTLIAIATVAMSSRLRFDIYRTRILISSDSLYLASQAVSFWAMNELADEKKTFRLKGQGGRIEKFPQKLQSLYPHTIIKGDLYDLQARFNLNNLVDKKHEIIFLNLLKNLIPDLHPEQRKKIVKAISYWITPYQLGHGQDKSMTYYQNQKPSYLPSHQFFQNVSELRLVEGVNAKLYQKLNKYLTALPGMTAININTAPLPLLKALENPQYDTQAKEIQITRDEKPIDNRDLNTLFGKFAIYKELIGVESEYFMSIATVINGETHFTNYSIIKRTKDKAGKISLSLLSETLNSFD